MNSRRFLPLATALALSACAGNVGGGAIPPAAIPAAVQSASGTPVTFVVTVPAGAKPAAFGHAPQYISASTQSVEVVLKGSLKIVMDVAASSHECSKRAGGRRCSSHATVPNGTQTFDVTAFDEPNGTGNELAAAHVTATLDGHAQRVNLSLDGVAASLAIALQLPHPNAGSAAESTVSVSALDADGNTILGSYGRRVRLSDSDGSGATALSAKSVTDSTTAVTLQYTGAPLDNAVISAKLAGVPTASVSFQPAPTTTAQFVAPLQKTKNGMFPLGVSDACQGPDGNIWATGYSSGAIVKIDPKGHYTIYSLLQSGPDIITVGPDKNMWFAENLVGKIGKVTTAGVITSYKIPVPKGAQSQPTWTATGPDGRVWFVNNGIYMASQAGAIEPSTGKMSLYDLPAHSGPMAITAGPDGNMWLTDQARNSILVLSTSGKVVANHPLPTASAAPWGITTGPDKNLWFAEYGANKIGRITPAGKVTEYEVPTPFAGPLNVAAGPDGRVWFTESGGGFWDFLGKVGYVTTDGATIRDFSSPGAGGHVHNLTFDSKGVLWYTKFSGPFSSVSTFVY